MAQKLVKPKKANKGRFSNEGGFTAQLNLIHAVRPREKDPEFRGGDTVKVHVRIKEGEKERIQIFEGHVIKMKHREGRGAFTVRKMSHGVGVERVFQFNSPKVAKIELVQKGKVRRAKLYYIRELKGKAARIDKLVEVRAPKKTKEASTAKA